MVSTTIGKSDYVFTFKKHICVGEPEEVTESYTGLFQPITRAHANVATAVTGGISAILGVA
jgi:hypothetical protein